MIRLSTSLESERMVGVSLGLILASAVAILVLADGASARGHNRPHRHDKPRRGGPSTGQSTPGPCPGEVLNGALSESFYNRSCPAAITTVENIITREVQNDLTVTAGLLRLHFHDCFVRGCDASVLLNTSSNSELEALPNKGSLRGMDIIEKVKAAVEAICPGVVSCADIVALASRDSLVAIGGPSFRVPLGRRDGLVSLDTEANNNLPSPLLGYTDLVQNFAAQGLRTREMIVLSGAHTIGRAHCSLVFPRIWNFDGVSGASDPLLNSNYVQRLRDQCPQNKPLNLVALDPSGKFPNTTFDSNYYSNVLAKSVAFNSDSALGTSTSAVRYVSKLASRTSVFFSNFQCAMEKMGRIGVLTGHQGEIRKQCFKTNSY